MQSYKVNQGKRKKAIKQLVKTNVKAAKGFVKFCYGLTWFLRILAVILGLANILYVVFLNRDAFNPFFLIAIVGYTYGLSFLPAAVYIFSISNEYSLRKREAITFVDGGFVYSFHDDRVGLSDSIFAFNVLYENISRYDYDDKTKILTLYGKIVGETYENGELKESDEYNEISLLDVYDFSVKQLLDESGVRP